MTPICASRSERIIIHDRYILCGEPTGAERAMGGGVALETILFRILHANFGEHPF